MAYVQNSLINIEGMNGGSISVFDFETGEKVDSIDKFKDAGLTINMMVLTPRTSTVTEVDGGGGQSAVTPYGGTPSSLK